MYRNRRARKTLLVVGGGKLGEERINAKLAVSTDGIRDILPRLAACRPGSRLYKPCSAAIYSLTTVQPQCAAAARDPSFVDKPRTSPFTAVVTGRHSLEGAPPPLCRYRRPAGALILTLTQNLIKSSLVRNTPRLFPKNLVKIRPQFLPARRWRARH